MPKLSEYVRRARGATTGGDKAKAAPPPPPPLSPPTAAPTAPLPRYRDGATGRLLPEGMPPPPRPSAHVRARREWRGLVRYCCAAVSAATGQAVPLPPDADDADDAEAKEGAIGSDDGEGDDELVPALEDPEAPWAAHYAALLRGVNASARRGA